MPKFDQMIISFVTVILTFVKVISNLGNNQMNISNLFTTLNTHGIHSGYVCTQSLYYSRTSIERGRRGPKDCTALRSTRG